MNRGISLKTLLRNRELTIGSWLSFGNTQTCEIMARAGFDWLVVDMEHTVIDYEQCLMLIQVIESNGTVPLVRVGGYDAYQIKRVMDAGAHGIIVPQVNSLEDVRKAIDAVYYPSIGSRGVGLGRAQDYGIGFDSYQKWASRETILIPQIEHIKGVENLEDILSEDLVDGFIVGPYDLTGSLGVPGQWDDKSFIEAISRIKQVMKTVDKPGGYHVVHSDQDNLKLRISEGYRFIAYGDDMVFFAEKIANENNFISRLKN